MSEKLSTKMLPGLTLQGERDTGGGQKQSWAEICPFGPFYRFPALAAMQSLFGNLRKLVRMNEIFYGNIARRINSNPDRYPLLRNASKVLAINTAGTETAWFAGILVDFENHSLLFLFPFAGDFKKLGGTYADRHIALFASTNDEGFLARAAENFLVAFEDAHEVLYGSKPEYRV